MQLTGYQGLNNGRTETISLGTIGAISVDTVVWGTAPGNLFASDYDDEYGSFSNPGNPACTINDTQYGVSQYYYCADVGNFYVTLTAQWNGNPIYSQFSPGQDPLGIGNACGNTAGCYIGWEGLDANGWSETANDDHSSGGPNGVLANIYVGAPPPVGAPEPGSLTLLAIGLATVIGAARRRM
jgi:hypothetical protein